LVEFILAITWYIPNSGGRYSTEKLPAGAVIFLNLKIFVCPLLLFIITTIPNGWMDRKKNVNDLGNSTGTFSQESFQIQDLQSAKQVSFIFTPAINLKPGEYMLMLGAQNNEVGMLKAVKVHVIS
jgi:hypothetical protein